MFGEFITKETRTDKLLARRLKCLELAKGSANKKPLCVRGSPEPLKNVNPQCPAFDRHVHVEEITGFGKGLVATRDFKIDELPLQERLDRQCVKLASKLSTDHLLMQFFERQDISHYSLRHPVKF